MNTKQLHSNTVQFKQYILAIMYNGHKKKNHNAKNPKIFLIFLIKKKH